MHKFKTILLILLIAWANVSWACGHPPPPPPEPTDPPPMVWVIDHGIDRMTGLRNMWFGVEIDPELFPISAPTICSCGIGIGGINLPAVASLNVTKAMLGVTNLLTHKIDFLPEFDFAPDPDITNDAEANALIVGQQWSGFSTIVNSFTQPIYAANEVLKLWFNVEIAPADLAKLRAATSNQKIGFSIGGDPRNQEHLPQQFTAFKVSTPAITSLLVFGALLIFLGKSKRSRK